MKNSNAGSLSSDCRAGTGPFSRWRVVRLLQNSSFILCVAWIAVIFVATPCKAYMTIEAIAGNTSAPSPQYDRFQNDPSFIGSAVNWSGVGMAFSATGQSGDWATMISPSYFISAGMNIPAARLTTMSFSIPAIPARS